MKRNLNLYLLKACHASARVNQSNLLLAVSFFTLLFMLIGTSASAQSKTITGIVRDDNREVLEGVSVMVKGTSQGVLTDSEGRFSISVDVAKNDMLVFSFIGKKSYELSIVKVSEFDLTLYNDPSTLIEVVVTGEGAADQPYTERKSDRKRSRKKTKSIF